MFAAGRSGARHGAEAMIRLDISPVISPVSARAFYYRGFFYGFRYAG
jgi:hypothetical protein